MHHHTDDHPRRNEDEYFLRQNAELIKRMRARLDDERRKQERTAHFMKCPRCGADLKEREAGSVKFDVCPECHGLWIDQGEIDLIQQVRQLEASLRPEHRSSGPGPLSRMMQDILDMFHRPK